MPPTPAAQSSAPLDRNRVSPRWWIVTDLDEEAFRAEHLAEQAGGSSSSSASCAAAAEAGKPELWEQALDAFRQKVARKKRLTPAECSSLIGACAGASRCEEVLEVLDKVKKRGIRLDETATEVALVLCAKYNHWEQATSLLRNMQSHQMHPSAVAFDAAIASCWRHLQKWDKYWRFPASKNCWDMVLSMFEDMRSRGFEPAVDSFDAAISICEVTGQEDRARNLCEEVNRLHFRRLVAACSKHGRWEKAVALLQTVRDRGYGPPDQPAHILAIEACGRAGRWKKALAVVNCLREQGVTPSQEVVEAARKVLLANRQNEAAADLQATMRLTAIRNEGVPRQSLGGASVGTSSTPLVRRATVKMAFNKPPVVSDDEDEDEDWVPPRNPQPRAQTGDESDGERAASLAKSESEVMRSSAFEEQFSALTQTHCQDIEKIIAAFDTDHSGTISVDMLLSGLDRLGLSEVARGVDLEAVLSESCRRDKKTAGKLDLRRFLRSQLGQVIARRVRQRLGERAHEQRRRTTRLIMRGLSIAPGSMPSFEASQPSLAAEMQENLLNNLRAIMSQSIDLFQSWDIDGRGMINRDEFRRGMIVLGIRGLQVDDLDALFEAFNEDHTGYICYRDLAKSIRPSFRHRDRGRGGESLVYGHSRSKSPLSSRSPDGSRNSPRGCTSPALAPSRPCSRATPRPRSRGAAASPSLGPMSRPVSQLSTHLSTVSRPGTQTPLGAASAGRGPSSPCFGRSATGSPDSLTTGRRCSSSSLQSQAFHSQDFAQLLGREKLEPVLFEMRSLQESMRRIVPKESTMSSEDAHFFKLNFKLLAGSMKFEMTADWSDKEDKPQSASTKSRRSMAGLRGISAVPVPPRSPPSARFSLPTQASAAGMSSTQSSGGSPRKVQSEVPPVVEKSLNSENPTVIASLEPEELAMLKDMEKLEEKEQVLLQRRTRIGGMPAGSRYRLK